MNLKRKVEMQERHITALQNQIERLKKDNNNLRQKNEMLNGKIAVYESQTKSIEDVREDYLANLDELKGLQEKYQQAIYDAQCVKEKYEQKFKQLVGKFRLKI